MYAQYYYVYGFNGYWIGVCYSFITIWHLPIYYESCDQWSCDVSDVDIDDHRFEFLITKRRRKYYKCIIVCSYGRGTQLKFNDRNSRIFYEKVWKQYFTVNLSVKYRILRLYYNIMIFKTIYYVGITYCYWVLKAEGGINRLYSLYTIFFRT